MDGKASEIITTIDLMEKCEAFFWNSKGQAYGTVSLGMELYKNIQLGCRATIFSRPSRYFTANASVVIGYAF